MRNGFHCFFTLFLALVTAALLAQTPAFEKITIENGLSQGMIFDICQTRDGFLWVATKDGLDRYDGYNFKVFSNNPFDPFSIAENTVTKLFEDSRGRLWAGLSTKGVDMYEPRTGRFHHFPVAAPDSKIYNSAEVIAIAETADGSIWFAQRGGGLWRVAVPNDWQNGLPDKAPPSSPAPATSVPVLPESPSTVESLFDIVRMANGEMLLTSNRRQLAFDPKSLAQRPVNQALFVVPSPGFNFGQCAIHNDTDGGDMWFYRVIGNDDRLEYLRVRNGQLAVFPAPKLRSELRWGVMAPGDAGHSWAVMNGKVWDLSPGEDLDLSRPDFEFDQFITCFERDRAGNLWFGTNGYGLRKLNPTKHNFHASAAGNSLGQIWASGGHYFAKKNFWIYAFGPQTGRLSDKIAFGDGLGSRQVNLAFEPSGGLWLLSNVAGEANGTLRYFAPGQFERPAKTYDFQVSTLGQSDPLLRARDGRLYVAVANWRLIRFDPKTEHFDYFDYSHLFDKQVNATPPLSLAEDAAGVLWIGTQQGLVKAASSAQGVDFQLIETNPNKPDGLSNNVIASILPMPDGQLWLGTKGGGINILDEKTGRVRHLTTDDGLLNNVVYGILPGSRTGEFWCSTNRGLAKIVAPDQLDGKFNITTFTAALGLQDNEFNTYSFCKTETGELLFGGINGLNRFQPDELRADTTPPPVRIVAIEINNQKADIRCPENLPKLELSHEQNNVSIEFAALDFTDPSKNRYRYQLVGLDKNWVETGNHRFAHFSHLAPGKYELRVQGSNGESAWHEAMPLAIVVNPPWWRSNLAYLVYLLLLAWAGWRTYQFQIQRIKDREQLAFEHRETERVKALEQLKTNFFSNVTHEFRTPLTLMIEPLRRVLEKTKEPETLENVRLAASNSQKLLSLVNQLLDMAKLESGQMSLDLRRANLTETVRGVFGRFLPLAEKRGVKLVLAVPPAAPPEFDFDPGKVELVLNNLISNALKFTPKDGTVKVGIEYESPGFDPDPSGVAAPSDIRHSTCTIKISDTGIGIGPENLGKIFDRFYQVDSSNTRVGEGTGIGLALSKELAELMGGGIAVESGLGKGSTFRFWLPFNPDSHRDVELAVPEGRVDLTIPTVSGLSNLKYNVAAAPAFSGEEKPVALVIEDNAELRSFIKKSIGENWQVLEAADGAEGIEKAIECVPDIVISDVMMPRKDGLSVCNELKNNELTAHVPIVLLTAKSSIEARLSGLRRGADDYLTKPFSTEELLARMTNLVETRRRLRKIFGKQAAQIASTATMSSPKDSGEEAQAFLSEPDRQFLQKFTSVLEENLENETLGVEDFARKMYVSRVQLHRKLKALTNQSATDFIRDFRLERAFYMLKNREGLVGEVAIRVGFGNDKYFSTVFKEKFGVPPSQVN